MDWNLSIIEPELDIQSFSEHYLINTDTTETTRFIGFSIQQYSKRKFKTGEREVKAYEDVIKQMPEAIARHLQPFIQTGIDPKNLHLGDIPYVYSLVPLSQTSKMPIFDLSFAHGIRGNQVYNVEEYKAFIERISKTILINIGEEI